MSKIKWSRTKTTGKRSLSIKDESENMKNDRAARWLEKVKPTDNRKQKRR